MSLKLRRCCRKTMPGDITHTLLCQQKWKGGVGGACRYLGTEMGRTLSRSAHSVGLYRKAQQRLFLLRKPRCFSVSKNILTMVKKSLTESLLSSNILSWHNFLCWKHRLSGMQAKSQTPVFPFRSPHSCNWMESFHCETLLDLHIHSTFHFSSSVRLPLYKVFQSRTNLKKTYFVSPAIIIINKE